QAVAGRAEPGVLYLLSVEPPMAAGPGSFVDDLITLAGGHNIFADAAQAWPTVSLEEIVRRQPDIIIRPGMRALEDPLAGIAGRPGWRDLAAVRGGRIHGVDPDLFNRAGITVAQTARELARYFHGAAVLAERP
ncbi:MAG TPA: ABC transporter substrate-binding protein, partial [Longimicrobiales bacterium]|nr:ABC transporter substrate-binding protein [Longimicrobiales bacterium]